jgi:hypothetical protein
MKSSVLVKKVGKEIQKSKPEEQQELLTVLPHLLNINLSELILLKLAEKSFDFWNNSEDMVYDSL